MQHAAAQPHRANIVFIVADDLGYADLGCCGGRNAGFGPVSPVLGGVAGAAATGNAPYFLSLHYTAPHWPWETRNDAALAQQTASRCCRCCQDPAATFDRSMAWRMKHRGQRAYRLGHWMYLQVHGHAYLFNVSADGRERANHAQRQPELLAALRQAWVDWGASMPAIADDATVRLGYGIADMPQR